MFLNNFGGTIRPNWQSPYLGQNIVGNPLAYGQNVLGQVPFLWNQVPFATHFGAVPYCYTVGNVMGQLLPQTIGQPIGTLNTGIVPSFAGIPFSNATLGYGINNTLGQGFTTLAGTFQNPFLGCC
jgi:hypothetical protein